MVATYDKVQETDKLRRLAERIRNLSERESRLMAKWKKEYDREAYRQLGLKVGCLVQLKDGRKFQVTRIGEGYFLDWLRGVPIKKDGTPGVRDQCLYDYWEVVKGEA